MLDVLVFFALLASPFWVALFLLTLRDYWPRRNEPRIALPPGVGMTWRSPWYWIIVLVLWPGFLAVGCANLFRRRPA
jgi:hypothetical protein